MSDLISRKAAIDAINHICPIETEYDCTLLDRVDVRCVLSDLPSAQPHWIPCSERLPKEDGDYFVTYEKGYAEDYDLSLIGIERFEVDCESFGYWHEYFDEHTLGSLGSEWEKIKVVAWMPLPDSYKGEHHEID